MTEGVPLSDYYSTHDVSLCAFLSMNGFVFDVVWGEKTCQFKFLRSEEFNEALETYASGDASVEPRAFSMSHTKVRNAMFDHPESPKQKRKSGR